MIIPIDASYLYFFVVRKQQRQPLVNNIHVCDDTEGVSTAVHVMSIVQSEGKFAHCSRDPRIRGIVQIIIFWQIRRSELNKTANGHLSHEKTCL